VAPAAKTATTDTARWTHLERAHILSQPDPWLHTGNHLAMFSLAVRQRDRREALGQVVRITAAAPASLVAATPRATRAAPASDCGNRCRHRRIRPPYRTLRQRRK
jgi:hypothetical protein